MEAIIMVPYIAVTSLIALLASRQNKTSGDLFLGAAGFGVTAIVAMTFSETIGGTGTVGDCAEAMSGIGMAAVWSSWGIAAGCILFVWAFGRFYRIVGKQRGVRSVAGAYEVLFGRRTKVVVLVIVALVYACMFALQPVAATALLAPMFGVDRTVMFVVVGALFILIACMGGLKGLARMNRVHAFVMWFGLLLVAALSVRAAGGFEHVAAVVPEGYFSPFYPGLATVAIWFVGAVLSQMNSAIMTTITLSAGSIKAARKGVLAAAVLILAFACFPALTGISALVLAPGADPQSALYAVSSSLNPWVGGLCSIAIVAAIFSTGPTLLLIVGTTITEDLYRSFVNKQASDKQVMVAARVVMVAIGIVAVALGSQTTSIFSQLISIFQIRSIVSVILIVALAWHRVNDDAAFWSMLLGGGIAAVWHFAGAPFGVQPLLPALLVGLVVLVGMTIASKERISTGYLDYLHCQRDYALSSEADARVNLEKVDVLIARAERERQ